MYSLIGIVTTVLLALRMRKIMSTGSVVADAAAGKETANGSKGLDRYWDFVANQYIIPMGQTLISYFYGLYLRFSILNVVIFVVKYVPTVVFMYKFMKRIYVTSQERIIHKQMELEDIQLQIQIVNTKLCVRDAEFTERAEQLRRGAERLRLVRTRVRDLIAADDTLRRTLENAKLTLDTDSDLLQSTTPEQDQEFLMEILKELKYDQNLVSENPPQYMDCGEHAASEPVSENSVYSSLSDADKDCHVKIVRVTNVYKVSYLKDFIKQKRLRRANRQALLKKKIDNTKKQLEDWQKSLNMVINSTLNIINGCVDSRAKDTSQEAMGDYSKPTLRESSNSDSDLRNCSDLSYDEYWSQIGPDPNYPDEYEDLPESQVAREYCDSQEFSDMKNQSEAYQQYDRSKTSDKLSPLLEETKSQILFEDNKSNEAEVGTCHDLIDL